MEIYRFFDAFMNMSVVYKNSYNVLHANTKLYIAAIACGVAVWAALQILLGVGLYVMAKKRNMPKRYMAFIPFVNMIYAGRLAGDTRFFGQRMKHAGVFVMAAQLAAFLLGIFTIVSQVILYSNYELKVVDNSLVYMTSSGVSPTSALANFLIKYESVAALLLSIVELVYTVFLFMLASSLFRTYSPASYTVLSFLTLFVPTAFYIVVFVLRNRRPVDYAAYMRKKQEAYYRRYGNPPYANGSPYSNSQGGGYGGYGGGNYGSSANDDPFKEYGAEHGRQGASAAEEPFAEFGGKNDGENGKDGGSPFTDIDG